MAEQPKKTYTAEKKIHNFELLSLFTPVEGTKLRSKLLWGIRGNFPRLTVFTNYPDDKIAGGTISAVFDHATLNVVLDLILDVAKATSECNYKIACYTSVWKDNKITEERKHSCDLRIGKDKEGIVWIALVLEGRPKIKFTYQLSDFYTISDMSKGQASSLIAASHVNRLRDAFNKKLNESFNTDKPETEPVNTAASVKPATEFSDIEF